MGMQTTLRAPSPSSTLRNLISGLKPFIWIKSEVGALLRLPSHLVLSQDGDRGLYTSENTRVLKITYVDESEKAKRAFSKREKPVALVGLQ